MIIEEGVPPFSSIIANLDAKRLNEGLTLDKINGKIKTRKERKEKLHGYKITYHLYHLKHY